MGGNMQPQGQLQTLVRMLDYDQQPQAACDAPAEMEQRSDRGRRARPGREHGRRLRARGHVLEGLDDPYMDFGSGQFIWRLGDPAVDGYVSASDSRRDGLAAGDCPYCGNVAVENNRSSLHGIDRYQELRRGRGSKVTFLGLGVMGLPMAGHLARAGHHVTVYNRTPAKAQAWASEWRPPCRHAA